MESWLCSRSSRTHTNNIVPVSSSMHGVLVCTPVPRQKVYSYIYFYTEIGLYFLKNSCPEIESGGLRYLADYLTLVSKMHCIV